MVKIITKDRGSDITMNINQCKEIYESLKKGKNFIANIDKDFFLNFAETLFNELEKKDEVIDEMVRIDPHIYRVANIRLEEREGK